MAAITVLVLWRHFYYLASLAGQAYVGLAPADFRVYGYQLAFEVLLLLIATVLLYRWSSKRLSG